MIQLDTNQLDYYLNLIIMTIVFYIIKHMTFENENVIFSNRNDALKYINERKIELDKLYGCDIYHI